MHPSGKGFRIFSRIAATPVSIRIRFMGFVFLLVSILFLLVIMMLYLTGTLTVGQKESGEYFAQSLRHTKADIELDFGRTSMQAIDMSETVSSSMEDFLSDHGIQPSDLEAHPEILEELLDDQFDRLLFSLEKSGTSGAFIILDATVNPSLENASTSRSALYVRNMEPNAVSAGTPNMTMLHGFPDISRQQGYSLNSIWSMEFDLSMMPEYEEIRAASQGESTLSQLYLWSEARPLLGSNEDIMMCIVPLLDENGQFFGVCGFEVSGMLFKLRYSPDTTAYKRVTSLICPVQGDNFLMVGKSLCGGDDNSIRTILSDTQSDPDRTAMKAGKDALSIHIYRFASSDQTVTDALRNRYFVGLHETVTLLPSDSVFKDQVFSLMLLMPESEYSTMLGKNNIKIVFLCALFILVGVLLAVLMSRKFAAPILKDLSKLAIEGDAEIEGDGEDPMKTPEIMAILAQIRSRHPRTLVSDAPDELFDDFLAKIRRLTPTEKQIVLRFLEDKSTQDVLNEMFISASTLKTHNSHIYAKLDAVSRDELQLYFRLIEKTGRLEDLRKALSQS